MSYPNVNVGYVADNIVLRIKNRKRRYTLIVHELES
jgi:hypothetical protein